MARQSKSVSRTEFSGSTSDRRQRRSADIRERLFLAALDLFAQKGFAETTVEDITEAAVWPVAARKVDAPVAGPSSGGTAVK